MRIGIDIRSLAEAEPTGIPGTKQALIDALIRASPQDEFHLWFNAARRGVPSIVARWQAQPNVRVVTQRWPNRMINGLMITVRRPRLDRILASIDVCLALDWQMNRLTSQCPLVTVVHDLSFQRQPEFLNWRKALWHRLVRPLSLIERSQRIVAVSEATRRELVEWRPELADRVAVINHGFSPSRFRQQQPTDQVRVKQVYGLPESFLLVVATREPRKNLEGLLAALADAPDDWPEIVLVGSGGWGQDWLDTLDPTKSSQIHCLGYVPEADLPALYQLASLTLFPSLAEGFGLPPLESLAAGTPVVAATRGAIPEISRAGVMLVDPTNSRDITRAVRQLLDDDGLRRRLVADGQAVVDHYDWPTTAMAVLTILHEAGGQHAHHD